MWAATKACDTGSLTFALSLTLRRYNYSVTLIVTHIEGKLNTTAGSISRQESGQVPGSPADGGFAQFARVIGGDPLLVNIGQRLLAGSIEQSSTRSYRSGLRKFMFFDHSLLG